MRDTSADIEARFHARLMELTPAERLAMAGDMFDTAKTLVLAAIRAQGIHSRQEVRRLLFLRFYGQDFDEASKAEILAGLGKTRGK
jgi:hypothetical protein